MSTNKLTLREELFLVFYATAIAGVTKAVDRTHLYGRNRKEVRKIFNSGPIIEEWVCQAVKSGLDRLISGCIGSLKLISEGRDLIIPPTDGEKILTQFPKIFKGYSDGEFCRVDRGQATSKTQTEIYENTKYSLFVDLYGAFGVDLELLGLTQEQVAVWVKTHRRYLARKSRVTYFLLSTGVDVAAVRVLKSGKVGVTHRPLSSRNHSVAKDRFVVRKITYSTDDV